jgi:hypothetical protein
VRAEHGGDPAIEVPAHRDLLAGQLGVKVHDDRVGRTGKRLEELVDRCERGAIDLEVHLPAQVDHRDSHPGRLDDRVAAARVRGAEVRRADDSPLRLEVGVDVLVSVAVVTERDHVGAGLEQLLGGVLGDPDATGGVLPVHHHQVGHARRAELGHRRG